MRKLYIVPILHMSADMGSLASVLDETARAEFGKEAWQRHQEAVAGFWDHIGKFCESMDVQGYKIYQDGMVADGTDGLRIVREGIGRGSKNYEIIGKLVNQGAILVKTEDLALVKEEYAHVARIARARPGREKETWALRYKLSQERLLRQRDDYIAERIDRTLGEGETGILFIGAQHKVESRLPESIKVVTLKCQM